MLTKHNVIKIELPNEMIPKYWYNVLSEMKDMPPYLNPQTQKPSEQAELEQILSVECVRQETTTEKYIEIPKEVRDIYRNYRFTPLIRARGLEKLLDTPARIYYKYEGSNATGSHKLNSAVPQAFYNSIEGTKHLTTETGAGQWGSALSMACSFYDLSCDIYMVKCSYEQKPSRRTFMETFGGQVYSSPTNRTLAGREILAKDPNCSGSLGIAISEAMELAATTPGTKYALGSVLNHVLLHQTVIGQEAKQQLEVIDEFPDVVVACTGGGSNFGGMVLPFYEDKLKNPNLRFVAVEPEACPTLTKGKYEFDYSDTGKVGPISKMYTLGSDFMPASIHAGGLRYHGMSPIISKLYNDEMIEAKSYNQFDILKAGLDFAKAECIVPAPESCHAIKAAMDEALKAKEEGKEKVILFCLSGHGYLDLYAYEKFLNGVIPKP